MLALFSVTNVELPGARGLEENVMEVPAGTPAVAVNTIGVVKPPDAVVERLAAAVAGDGQDAVTVAPGVKVKPDGGVHALEVVNPILSGDASDAFTLLAWSLVKSIMHRSSE